MIFCLHVFPCRHGLLKFPGGRSVEALGEGLPGSQSPRPILHGFGLLCYTVCKLSLVEQARCMFPDRDHDTNVHFCLIPIDHESLNPICRRIASYGGVLYTVSPAKSSSNHDSC